MCTELKEKIIQDLNNFELEGKILFERLGVSKALLERQRRERFKYEKLRQEKSVVDEPPNLKHETETETRL
jgi:hypothetical protein